jgi:hypothetical protein
MSRSQILGIKSRWSLPPTQWNAKFWCCLGVRLMNCQTFDSDVWTSTATKESCTDRNQIFTSKMQTKNGLPELWHQNRHVCCRVVMYEWPVHMCCVFIWCLLDVLATDLATAKISRFLEWLLLFLTQNVLSGYCTAKRATPVVECDFIPHKLVMIAVFSDCNFYGMSGHLRIGPCGKAQLANYYCMWFNNLCLYSYHSLIAPNC